MLSASSPEVSGPVAIITGPSGISVTSSSIIFYKRILFYLFSNCIGEFLSVNSQCPSCLNGIFLSTWYDQRTQNFHFFFEKSGSRIVSGRFQGIGTYKFCQTRIMMCRRIFMRVSFHIYRTFIPALARRHAASQPASPPPIILTVIKDSFRNRSQAFHIKSFPDFPPFLKSVLPHFGHLSSTGAFHVIKLQSGYPSQTIKNFFLF